VKGQLGVGDKLSRYYPQMLLRDIMDKDLPPFKSVACGYFNTFAVDGMNLCLFEILLRFLESGNLYSWGGGNLGQKNVIFINKPKFNIIF